MALSKRKRDYRQIDLYLIWASYDGLCGICQEPVSLENFTLDHIIPMCKGGKTVEKNLQPAHEQCNRLKDDKMPWDMPKPRRKKLGYRNWPCYNARK